MAYAQSIIITPSDTISKLTEINVDAVVLGSDTSSAKASMTGLSFTCQLKGDDHFITFTGLEAGRIYPFQIRYIKATDTNASTIIGLRSLHIPG
ncbi:MAG: hypothetical protein QF535_15435 [Anaerolineales bacterium]|jgi:hypothetical protein|nr:hypothetical protein [Anaerolineales bacterium]